MVVGGRELIDTLWNVNKHWFKGFLDSDAGINRYIMECKLKLLLVLLATKQELIDTLWNVNTMIEQMRRLATWN